MGYFCVGDKLEMKNSNNMVNATCLAMAFFFFFAFFNVKNNNAAFDFVFLSFYFNALVPTEKDFAKCVIGLFACQRHEN